MSTTLTLQAALVLPKNTPLAFALSIPSGTVLTFSDALDQDSVAEQLAAISPAALVANRGVLDRDVAAPTGLPGVPVGDDAHIKYGVRGDKIVTAYGASSSVSSSTSSSVSSSVSGSVSSSVSSSVSKSPSSSASASSDARLKSNIVPLENALGKLASIRGVGFAWNQDAEVVGRTPGVRDVGVIAQEVEQAFPELVSTDEAGYKRVNYNGLVGVLFAAVAELHAKVGKLEKPRALAAGAQG